AGDVPLYCQNHGDKGGQGMSMVVHVTAGSAAASAVATSAAVTTAAPTGVPTKAPLATTAAVPSVATKQASAATSVSTAAATASAGAAQAVQVVLNDDVFQPKEITVPAGSIVHFVNNGKHRHTVTADDDSFDSGQLKPGDSFDQTFARAGDVPLYCQNHGDKGGQGMSMVVHVTAASAAASSPVATTAVPPTAASGAALATLAPTSSLLDPKVLAAVDSLVISANDTPNKTAYAVGMAAQMAIIKAQAAAITQALAQARYEDAQAAAEAILNVSEGGPGQDRDTDGKINQPGDTFGLKPYIFAVNETANTLQGLVASTDPLQAGALAIQSTGRSALTDLQALSQQAQALLDAKTLVDARKVGPPLADAAAKLDLDVATIVRTIPVIPGSHLTPAPSGS
ncbi:MAG TPA: cupredoxin domain-containing protein, partial [Aggregatilineales bacterium]|nr:cupredoxin domain-containing protein [Aggregatilineales bacterium]